MQPSCPFPNVHTLLCPMIRHNSRSSPDVESAPGNYPLNFVGCAEKRAAYEIINLIAAGKVTSLLSVENPYLLYIITLVARKLLGNISFTLTKIIYTPRIFDDLLRRMVGQSIDFPALCTSIKVSVSQ